MIPFGRHKARAIPGSVQYGTSGEKKTLTITIELEVPSHNARVGTYLYFSPSSADFSLERLRTLGWEGKEIKDIRDLSTIGKNEVEIDVLEELWEGKKRTKVEIVTNAAKPSELVSKDEFAARLQAILGGGLAPATVPPGANAAATSLREPDMKPDEIPF
jgi:hypothetical protein